MKRIAFTGGGSAGHVTPNLALLPALQQKGYDVWYIGSKNGLESDLASQAGIPFYGIDSGKWRRYFSMQNVFDLFNIFRGTLQAYWLLRRLQPQVVFSKGGFVACPVVWAAWLRRIPVIIHESDISPGLANRLSAPFARTVCLTFPESRRYVPAGKQLLTGLPLRAALLKGDAQKGRQRWKLAPHKPVILVMGGSQGAHSINQAVREALPALLQHYQLIHLCGKGKTDPQLEGTPGYRQFEYLGDTLPHAYALAEVVISRAGSTTINEIRHLGKLNLLIPLPKSASRGDQLLNAASFERQGISMVLPEEELNAHSLLRALQSLQEQAPRFRQRLSQQPLSHPVELIVEEIEKWAGTISGGQHASSAKGQ